MIKCLYSKPVKGSRKHKDGFLLKLRYFKPENIFSILKPGLISIEINKKPGKIRPMLMVPTDDLTVARDILVSGADLIEDLGSHSSNRDFIKFIHDISLEKQKAEQLTHIKKWIMPDITSSLDEMYRRITTLNRLGIKYLKVSTDVGICALIEIRKKAKQQIYAYGNMHYKQAILTILGIEMTDVRFNIEKPTLIPVFTGRISPRKAHELRVLKHFVISTDIVHEHPEGFRAGIRAIKLAMESEHLDPYHPLLVKSMHKWG